MLFCLDPTQQMTDFIALKQRAVIEFLFKEGVNAEDIITRLAKVYGNDALKRSAG